MNDLQQQFILEVHEAAGCRSGRSGRLERLRDVGVPVSNAIRSRGRGSADGNRSATGTGGLINDWVILDPRGWDFSDGYVPDRSYADEQCSICDEEFGCGVPITID